MSQRLSICAAVLWYATASVPALAQPDDATKIAQLEQRIAEQDARIDQLERTINELVGSTKTPLVEVHASQDGSQLHSAPCCNGSEALALANERGEGQDPALLSLSGDIRLRQEFNWSGRAVRDRSRSVMRARLKALYQPIPQLEIGARLVTGDPDDPNSADVTIGDFANDLSVNLDQAYVTGRFGQASVSAGKFELPFARTDLVWDGDFNPYGIAGNLALPLSSGSTELRLGALYSIVSEDAAGPGSDMLGVQASYFGNLDPAWLARLSIGYYDYRLHALRGADEGDFRSNLRALDGGYLSDFNIVDVIAQVGFRGFADAWPVQLSAEAVRNFGADKGVRDAILGEIALGRLTDPGDIRFSYGYLQAEADSVFAAFSHDNIALATNYRLHQLALEHQLSSQLSLGLLWYHYQPLDIDYVDADLAGQWFDRMRVNAVFAF